MAFFFAATSETPKGSGISFNKCRSALNKAPSKRFRTPKPLPLKSLPRAGTSFLAGLAAPTRGTALKDDLAVVVVTVS